MANFPTRTKYRKKQKGSLKGGSKAATLVAFGDFGIQALDRGMITQRQIEACRIVINRYFNRKGKVWIRIFPDKPITKKPAETRMGKGKGAVDHWSAPIRPGRILFEVGEVSIEDARAALRRAAAKLPLKTRFVVRLQSV